MALEIDIRTRGRADKGLPPVLGTRVLTEADVIAHSSREAGIEPSPLQRVSARHHALARLLAAGVRTGEAAARMGMTASRVSILKADQTFQDLVTFYKTQLDAADTVYHDSLYNLGLEAMQVLRDRLEDESEKFENDELIRLMEKSADRVGHAPKVVKEQNITVNFADKLDAARRRVIEAKVSAGEIIDIVEEGK